ncbi:MAG: TMAO reductase system periplasmic protein TorT [Pseudomonadota bacterium]
MRTFLSGSFLVLLSGVALAQWSPLKVDVWDPAFNKERKHHAETYSALDKASKPWQLCVAIPHLKDAYWMAVNYGLVEHAKQLGVSLTIHAAGGYEKLDEQRKQVAQCLADKADALILGAIKSDGLNDLIEKFSAQGKPVIDLINGIDSPKLTARTAADFYEMGKAAGDYAVKNIANGKPVKVGWFPGPKGAGWAEAGDQGFRSALAGKTLTIVDTAWGDTGLAAQGKLLGRMLDAHPGLNIIAGTAVTAEAAVLELRRRKLSDSVKVIAYYFAPAVHRGIQRNVIAAAPSDVPGLQARLAVDVAVRALEKKPHPKHLSAELQLIDAANVGKVDLSGSLAPEGFRAILSVNR